MKDLRKYFVLAVAMLIVSSAANAEITVKDTVSPEFLYNQGYSKEVSRVIDVKNVNPMTPIPAEQPKKRVVKWYLWKTIDPSLNRQSDWLQHNIDFHNTMEDL